MIDVSSEVRTDILPKADPLRLALLESRQRWRDMVALAADMAFETDAMGHFTFLDPDPVFGWQAGALIGQAAEQLLATGTGPLGCNPFRLTSPIRRQRVWINRPDGGVRCVAFSVTPLLDARGMVIGSRGVGVDVTELDRYEAQVVNDLRRGEVLDHILRCMREEVLAPRMMDAALDALTRALGGEGAAVIEADGAGDGAGVPYQIGTGLDAILPAVLPLMEDDALGNAEAVGLDGRAVLVCGCRTRFGEPMALALWRRPGSRPWDSEEHALVASASTIIRVILEHDAIQREMGRQARTDPLTGLFNRRAFLEELERHIGRLETEASPGTLMFLDLDHFKALNDNHGHEAGDEALRIVGHLLRRTVRPTDIVARLGGDEFAVWLNGADQFTAAERAEALRLHGPEALAHLVSGMETPLTMSIGIATRPAGSGEEIEALLRRADAAMYEVKRAGRGHWRVSQEGTP